MKTINEEVKTSRRVYLSEDGVKFMDEPSCIEYEKQLLTTVLIKLTNEGVLKHLNSRAGLTEVLQCDCGDLYKFIPKTEEQIVQLTNALAASKYFEYWRDAEESLFTVKSSKLKANSSYYFVYSVETEGYFFFTESSFIGTIKKLLKEAEKEPETLTTEEE